MKPTATRNAVKTERMTRMGLLSEPAGYVEGVNLYEFVGSNPVNRVDPLGLESATTQPTTQPIQDDNLDSDSALEHYKGGTGTPKWMPFSKIDTSAVKPTDFAKVRAEIAKGQGDRVVQIDDKLPFATSGNQSLFLGNITLRLQGTFTANDCNWTFEGTLKSYDDVYDFNKSTHRGLIGEALTAWGRSTTGKAFDINIRGSKDISESGTFSADQPKGNNHGSPWYYY